MPDGLYIHYNGINIFIFYFFNNNKIFFSLNNFNYRRRALLATKRKERPLRILFTHNEKLVYFQRFSIPKSEKSKIGILGDSI